MRASDKPGRSFRLPGAGLTALCVVGLVGACAMDPERLAYRDRLELGFLTPQDIERFRTPEQAQVAMRSAARDIQPLAAQVVDLELMRAAAQGNAARIKTLLSEGALVNAVDARRESALLHAVREGHIAIARQLLDAGALVDGRGGPMTPLGAASLRGNTQMARLLIRSGADIDATGSNELTPLMQAVKLNRPAMARLLLDAGANTRVVNRAGDNLLVVAILEDSPAMLSLLLSQGVPPDLADANGLTALYWAEHLKRPGLARLLRHAGADPQRRKSEIVESRPYNLGEY